MLTDKQLDMLFEMAEIHFQCFEKFYKEYEITYSEVLELNHKKLLDIVEGCVGFDEETLDFIFESILKDYKMMFNKENPYLDI
jgi:hypothetical protein